MDKIYIVKSGSSYKIGSTVDLNVRFKRDIGAFDGFDDMFLIGWYNVPSGKGRKVEKWVQKALSDYRLKKNGRDVKTYEWFKINERMYHNAVKSGCSSLKFVNEWIPNEVRLKRVGSKISHDHIRYGGS